MGKSLGDCGDSAESTLLKDMIERHGCEFEGLTKNQKLDLIIMIAMLLSHRLGDCTSEEKDETSSIILRAKKELTTCDKELLLVALANQVSRQRDPEQMRSAIATAS